METQDFTQIAAVPAQRPRALTPLCVLVVREVIRSKGADHAPSRRGNDKTTTRNEARLRTRGWGARGLHQSAMRRECKTRVHFTTREPQQVGTVMECDRRSNNGNPFMALAFLDASLEAGRRDGRIIVQDQNPVSPVRKRKLHADVHGGGPANICWEVDQDGPFGYRVPDRLNAQSRRTVIDANQHVGRGSHCRQTAQSRQGVLRLTPVHNQCCCPQRGALVHSRLRYTVIDP